jgi:hypothetical protein
VHAHVSFTTPVSHYLPILDNPTRTTTTPTHVAGTPAAAVGLAQAAAGAGQQQPAVRAGPPSVAHARLRAAIERRTSATPGAVARAGARRVVERDQHVLARRPAAAGEEALPMAASA